MTGGELKMFHISLSNFKPIKFHAYTSSVKESIFYMNYDQYYSKDLNFIKQKLLVTFNQVGIQCRDDNKIVFECEINGKRIYYGFYDGNFSIGLNYYDENETMIECETYYETYAKKSTKS
jgi:hypothetical protein